VASEKILHYSPPLLFGKILVPSFFIHLRTPRRLKIFHYSSRLLFRKNPHVYRGVKKTLLFFPSFILKKIILSSVTIETKKSSIICHLFSSGEILLPFYCRLSHDHHVVSKQILHYSSPILEKSPYLL
jgi:hypothetical protein